MTSTILFQPTNRIGLGHINRLASIALAIRQEDPSVRVPFVVEGPNHVLLDTLKLPWIALPDGHAMSSDETWEGWSRDERCVLDKSITAATVSALGPQVVVFDLLPNPNLFWLSLEMGIHVVLCLRAVKDTSQYLDKIAPMLPHIGLILVPDESCVPDFPSDLARLSRCVGRIVRPAITTESPAPSGAPYMIVTGGGGGYPDTVDFYNLAVQAFSRVRGTRPKLECRLVTGPLFKDWARLRLVENISVIPYASDLPHLLANARAVICQAGYNSIEELRSAGTPAVCIPAERTLDDQFARADSFARMRSNVHVLRESDPDRLAELLSECLISPRMAESEETAVGANRAARALLDFTRAVLLTEAG